MLATSVFADAPAIMEGGIDEALLRVHEFDRGLAVNVGVNEATNPDGLLFSDIETPLHPSYDATYDFCGQFNPYNKSDSEVSDEAIEQYLSGLLDMGPIQEAFFVTGHDTLDDLKKAWFRGGRGFEHIICGEGKGTKLGGYHFWYMHYRYERDGTAAYTGADYGSGNNAGGIADTKIVTGGMYWDADGSGGKPALKKKPKGGFSVGNSVAAMLAAGHIAYYGGDRLLAAGSGGRPRGGFHANLNGKTYYWTFHKSDGAIRTMWPRWNP